MNTRLFSMVGAAGLILTAFAAVEAEAAPVRARTEVEAIARELVAAIAAGDWAPWERHAADDLLYTTEFGGTLTKQELKAIFRPVDSGEQRTVTMAVLGFRSRGEVAVLVLDFVARAPDGVEHYRFTQTYWRLGGRWRLLASHACGVADDAGPPYFKGDAR
jgi:hypothetical protein